MAKPVPGRPGLIGLLPMGLRTIPTRVLQTEDGAATDAQRHAQMATQRTNQAIEVINRLAQPPFAKGELLTQPDGIGGRNELLALVNGDNDIPHTLGRPVEGFIVVDIQVRGDAQLFRISVSRSFDERFIRINAQHDCDAKIWVW